MSYPTLLTSLPPQTLEEVLTYLNIQHIYNLWKTGSIVLRSKLKLAIRQISVSQRTLTNSLQACPVFIFSLPNLRDLRLDMISWPRFPNILIETLPSTLHTLHLQLPLNESHNNYLSNAKRRPHQEYNARAMKDILPQLKHLKLRYPTAENMPVCDWPNLPPTLETLQFRCRGVQLLPPLRKLLPNLVLLENFDDFQTDSSSSLPEYITSLTDRQMMWNLRYPPSEEQSSHWSMPHLKNLVWFSRDYNSYESSYEPGCFDFIHCYPSLEHLSICLSHYHPNLGHALSQSNITNFKIEVGSELLPLQFYSSLPCSITHLTITILGWYQKTLLSSIFSLLPRGLTLFYLSTFGQKAGVLNEPWTAEELASLPSTLTSTNIIWLYPWSDDLPPIKSLFPHLISLHTRKSEGTVSNLDSLPSSVTSLRGLPPLDMKPTKIASAMHSLTSLKHLDSVTLGPMFVISRSEINAQPATYADGSSTHYIDPLEGLRPIEYGAKEEDDLFFLGELKSPFLLPTPKRLVSRLDLGLPTSIQDVFIFAQPWDQNKLIQRHDELEILCDSPSRSGTKPNFQHLENLTISLNCLDVTISIGKLPPTLRTLALSNISSPIALCRLHASLPDTLTHLSVTVHDARDEDLLRLPRALSYLGLWARANPSYLATEDTEFSYTTEGLKNLPQTLKTLCIAQSPQITGLDLTPSEAWALLPPSLTSLSIHNLKPGDTSWNMTIKKLEQWKLSVASFEPAEL